MDGFYHGSPRREDGNESARFVVFLVGLLAAFLFVLATLSLLERSSREVAGLVERLEFEERLSARYDALGVTGLPREELRLLDEELHARIDLITGGVRALVPPPSGAAPGSFEAKAPREAFLREFVRRFDVASLVIRACLVAILFILVFALYRLRASSSEYRRAKEAEDGRVRERAAFEEAERARIARELHDEGLQGIIGARMVLERYSPGMDGEEAAALVDLARASLASSLVSLREVLGSLRRAAPAPAGFLASLRALAARLSPVGSVRIEVEGPEPELEPAAAAALLKIAEEAAWNAMRHSGCSRILCRTERSGGNWLLLVEDDGRWREPEEDGRTRLGLAGMRERAAAAGLSLRVEGGERGTKVLVSAPAPAAPSPPAPPPATISAAGTDPAAGAGAGAGGGAPARRVPR